MKEGWTYKKLGEVATFMSGYTPDKSELFPQGKYPYFKVAEMNNPGNELFMRNTSLYIDSPKKVFPKGSIIFPKNGGAIYTEKKRILEYDSVIDLNSEAISPNGQIVLKYLFCFLNHIKISSFDKGGGLPSLDLKKMANSLIPLPSLSEQQRIVSRLDSAFAHIDELKANAEKQLGEARALFQRALTKAMEPKEGWEEKKLGELGELKNGMNFAHNEKGYDMFLLGVGDFGNRFSIDNVEQLSMISLNQKPSEDYMLIDGDIVFVRSNGNKQLVGRSVIVYPNETPVTFSGFCIRFRKNTTIINERFLVSFLKSEGTRRRLFGNGANISNLNQGMLQELIIPIPPLSEQQRIVSRLDSLSAHVRELEEVLQKTIVECDALKQALLRKVFE